ARNADNVYQEGFARLNVQIAVHSDVESIGLLTGRDSLRAQTACDVIAICDRCGAVLGGNVECDASDWSRLRKDYREAEGCRAGITFIQIYVVEAQRRALDGQHGLAAVDRCDSVASGCCEVLCSRIVS